MSHLLLLLLAAGTALLIAGATFAGGNSVPRAHRTGTMERSTAMTLSTTGTTSGNVPFPAERVFELAMGIAPEGTLPSRDYAEQHHTVLVPFERGRERTRQAGLLFKDSGKMYLIDLPKQGLHWT